MLEALSDWIVRAGGCSDSLSILIEREGNVTVIGERGLGPGGQQVELEVEDADALWRAIDFRSVRAAFSRLDTWGEPAQARRISSKLDERTPPSSSCSR